MHWVEVWTLEGELVEEKFFFARSGCVVGRLKGLMEGASLHDSVKSRSLVLVVKKEKTFCDHGFRFVEYEYVLCCTCGFLFGK